MKRKQQFVPGVLVVLAGTHVEPLISNKLGVPISYYTFSVHGLPALLGGLVAILMASLAEEKQGDFSLKNLIFRNRLEHIVRSCSTMRRRTTYLESADSGFVHVITIHKYS